MAPAPADSFESLADEIVALCANIHGAEYRLIDRIRQLEKLKPGSAEVPDCAHWLNLHCGMDLVTAREKVRIARSLDDLPQIDAAFHSGELGYSKVRAITRIAEPSTEDELIEMARETTAEHVARRVRARRQADHLAAPGAALNAWNHRYLDCRTAHDGNQRPAARRARRAAATDAGPGFGVVAGGGSTGWSGPVRDPGFGPPPEETVPGRNRVLSGEPMPWCWWRSAFWLSRRRRTRA